MCVTNTKSCTEGTMHSPLASMYTLNGEMIQLSDTYKYLWVLINSSLSWNCHITNITKKATKMLNFIKKFFKKLGKMHQYALKLTSHLFAQFWSMLWSLGSISSAFNPQSWKGQLGGHFLIMTLVAVFYIIVERPWLANPWRKTES